MTTSDIREIPTMTPAIRAAEAAKIAFNLHRYEHDPAADNFGMEAAEKIGVPPERVFKTLVAQVDGNQLVLSVPVTARLDLKKLAAALGGKKADLADPTRDFKPVRMTPKRPEREDRSCLGHPRCSGIPRPCESPHGNSGTLASSH